MHAIGLDIGTTSICGAAVDLESGVLSRAVTRPNEAALPGAHPWERLQDPAAIANACEALLGDVMSACPGIRAVGISGQMHGMLYLDETGRPLGPLATWQDERGNRTARNGRTYAQALSDATGLPAASGFGLVTLLHDAEEGRVPKGAARICTIGDYVGMALCGGKLPRLHASNAASLGGFSPEAAGFHDALPASLDRNLLPEVLRGEALIGEHKGIPVCCAIGDNQASVFGALGPGVTALVNVGTGSQISVVTNTPGRPANGLECRPYVGGQYLLVGAALCGGRSYRILRDFFRECAAFLGAGAPGSLYKLMDGAAERSLEESDPLTVDTRFAGTRQNPGLRGSIAGIGLDNLTPGRLCLGVLRGICQELHDFAMALEPPLPPGGTLAASGNGLRNSAVSRRIFSERFGGTLAVPRYREEAAYGAALIAAVAAGHLTYPRATSLVTYL